MRGTVTIVILLALALAPAEPAASAPPTQTSAWTHTRPLTADAAILIVEAATRSSIVRALLESLEGTDVVVYVSGELGGIPDEPTAYLRFIGRAAGVRYLLVQVDRWRATPLERIARLGHELHHAIEVAGDPSVTNTSSLAALYRRIGWQAARGRYETDGARTVSRLVGDQLAGLLRE